MEIIGGMCWRIQFKKKKNQAELSGLGFSLDGGRGEGVQIS